MLNIDWLAIWNGIQALVGDFTLTMLSSDFGPSLYSLIAGMVLQHDAHRFLKGYIEKIVSEKDMAASPRFFFLVAGLQWSCYSKEEGGHSVLSMVRLKG